MDQNTEIKNIKDFKENVKNYVLIGRIFQLFKNIRQIKSNNPKDPLMVSQDFRITDMQGTEIDATILGQEGITKFSQTIQQFEQFKFTNFDVKKNSLKDRISNLMLVFHQNSVIESVKGQPEENLNIPVINLKNLKNLKEIATVKEKTSIDIIAVIKKCSQIKTIKTGKQKRDLLIFDQSGIEFPFIIWGETGLHPDCEQGSIILIKNGIVGSYNGNKQISGFNQIIMFNEFQIPEVQQTFEWYQTQLKLNDGRLSSFQTKTLDEDENIAINLLEITTIKQLETNTQLLKPGERKIHIIKGYISWLKPSGQLYYLACCQDGCNRKAQERGNQFYCETHKYINFAKAIVLTNIRVCDSTGQCFINISGIVAQSLFNINPQELRQWVETSDQKELSCFLNNTVFNEYFFKIISEQDTFRGGDSVKHTIVKFQKADIKNEIEQYISIIEAYEDLVKCSKENENNQRKSNITEIVKRKSKKDDDDDIQYIY